MINLISSTTFLVTGGAGFIGSHLVDALLKNGHKVCVLDNFSTGNIANLPNQHENLEIINGDIRDTQTIDSALNKIDCIIHLAAIASVQAAIDDPQGTHQTNCVGTINLLQGAVNHGVKRFLFASSAAVYGNTNQLPINETQNLWPLTPYAIDKLSSEYYLQFFSNQFNLEVAIFRFFNVYGPRQDPLSPYSGVINQFIQQAISNQPITIYGDGKQSRDFVYVADVVNILFEACSTEKILVPITNIGTGLSTSLNQLVKQIQEIIGKPFDINFAEKRSGDILHSVADPTNLHQHYTLKASTKLNNGLKKLIAYLSKTTA